MLERRVAGSVNNKMRWTSHFVHVACYNIQMANNVHREVD